MIKKHFDNTLIYLIIETREKTRDCSDTYVLNYNTQKEGTLIKHSCLIKLKQFSCRWVLNYSPYNGDCVTTSDSNIIVKHTDNTAIVGLISNNDESVYQYGINHLVSCCKGNNLELNVCKTKELVVDNTRKQQKSFHPLSIKCAHVERVDNLVFTSLRPLHGPSTLTPW